MLAYNKPLALAAGLLVAFVLAALVIPHAELKRIMDGGRFGIAVMVAMATGGVAISTLRRGGHTGVDQFSIAVALLWTTIAFQALWVPLSREIDMPDWIDAMPISAFIVYLYIISAAFFLIPIGNRTGPIPTRNWYFLLWGGVIGGVAAGLMIGTKLSLLLGF